MTVVGDSSSLQPDPDVDVAAAPLSSDVDVVLVDDDPGIAALVKRVMDSHGHSLKWFDDGVAAVGVLCQPRISLRAKLILLDVSIPGLGGFGVLHYLRRDGVLEQSQIIMLTASVSEDDVRQAIDMGAIGYLAKPLNIRLLIDRVERVLRPSAESQPPSAS